MSGSLNAWAVVVAAGRGERAAQGINKVFKKIGKCSVLARTLSALQNSQAFSGIILVLSEDDFPTYNQLCLLEGPFPLVRHIAMGGATRAESVYSGLRCLPPEAEIVAIHDGARPFVSSALIAATIDSAREYGSGVAATAVVDTIKQVDEKGLSVCTPNRSTLCAAQTPQTFRVPEILSAYRQAFINADSATDDASFYERYIGSVRMVTTPDSAANKKLTTPQDFEEAERMLSMPRIGTGYDVHRLTQGRKLILCGVEVPHELGLLGHSDADVATHALMDALLGAAAMPDIGQLFPDSDPAYKGANSLILLENVVRKIQQAGMTIGNVDITIVAQRPKLAPFIEQMRANLSAVLGISPENIGLKATTTEHLGFEGEGLGISAQAVALLIQGQ